jgi:hypothetical protein
MPLCYPADAIPPEDRCTTCHGSGDHWENVWAPELDQYVFEPIAECPACKGTGVRPGRPLPLPRPPSWMPVASILEVASWEA